MSLGSFEGDPGTSVDELSQPAGASRQGPVGAKAFGPGGGAVQDHDPVGMAGVDPTLPKRIGVAGISELEHVDPLDTAAPFSALR